ncbi:unnamed protein product [Amaranthus hypochondriacus]
MYQALPYKAWETKSIQKSSPLIVNQNLTMSSSSNLTVGKNRNDKNNIKNLIDENVVIIFGKCGCCMNHVVRRLLIGLGVNPALHEVDELDQEFVVDQLERVGPFLNDAEGPHPERRINFPTLFIGGRWYGDLDRVIASHITGELTPILKDAGALWL